MGSAGPARMSRMKKTNINGRDQSEKKVTKENKDLNFFELTWFLVLFSGAQQKVISAPEGARSKKPVTAPGDTDTDAPASNRHSKNGWEEPNATLNCSRARVVLASPCIDENIIVNQSGTNDRTITITGNFQPRRDPSRIASFLLSKAESAIPEHTKSASASLGYSAAILAAWAPHS